MAVEATKKEQHKNKSAGSRKDGVQTKPRRPLTKNPRRKPRRKERVKPEFEHTVLGIRRVTRVVAGGRRFSFSVTLALGNRKGAVGVGSGKASDTALAIEKATRDAKKHMVTLALTKDKSIPHEVEAKYASARIFIYPARGKGLTAGGAARSVLELAGVKNVGAKILSRSKNKLNNSRATLEALKLLSTQ